VNESDTVTLICTADGNPTPSITWTRVSDNIPLAFPFTITGKEDEGGYRCTAENGVGNPDSDVTFINVQCRSINGNVKWKCNMSFTRHKLFVKEFYRNRSVTFNKLAFKFKRHNDQKIIEFLALMIRLIIRTWLYERRLMLPKIKN